MESLSLSFTFTTNDSHAFLRILGKYRKTSASFAATTLMIRQSEDLQTWTEGFINVSIVDVCQVQR